MISIISLGEVIRPRRAKSRTTAERCGKSRPAGLVPHEFFGRANDRHPATRKSLSLLRAGQNDVGDFGVVLLGKLGRAPARVAGEITHFQRVALDLVDAQDGPVALLEVKGDVDLFRLLAGV